MKKKMELEQIKEMLLNKEVFVRKEIVDSVDNMSNCVIPKHSIIYISELEYDNFGDGRGWLEFTFEYFGGRKYNFYIIIDEPIADFIFNNFYPIIKTFQNLNIL